MTVQLDYKSPTEQLLRSAFGPVEKIIRTEEEKLKAELFEIDAQITKLAGIRAGDYLPFEAPAILAKAKEDRGELKKRVKEMNSRLAEIEIENRQKERHIFMARHGYREQLDLALLTLGGNGGPAFMISPVGNDSGRCVIRMSTSIWSGRSKVEFYPEIPKAIGNRLETASREVFYHYSTLRLSAEFAGHAPEGVAEAIQKARASRLFDDILVIAEVRNWRVEKAVFKDDPIIAGWVEETQQLFFITAYDMTPLEEYFREQFAYGTTVPGDR